MDRRESFQQDVLRAISGISAPQQVTQATNQIQELLNENPNMMLDTLTNLLVNVGQNENDQKLLLTLIRRLPFPPIPASQQQLYDMLTADTHNAICSRLLAFLLNENNLCLPLTCETIKRIADALALRAEPYHDLEPAILQLRQSPHSQHRNAAYHLLPLLLQQQRAPTPDNHISCLFEIGLGDQDIQVRARAFCSLIDVCVEILDSSVTPAAAKEELKKMAPIIGPMLQVLPSLPQELLKAPLESLNTFVSYTPLLVSLRPHISDLINWLVTLAQNTSNEIGNRKLALECLLTLPESSPTLSPTNTPMFLPLEHTVPLLLRLMAEKDASDEAVKAFFDNEDFGTFDLEREGMVEVSEEAIDRIARIFGSEVTPQLQKCLGPMLQSSDWRERQAALNSFAVVAEGCAEGWGSDSSDSGSTTLESILAAVISLSSDPHPRVRFSSIYALGQFCIDVVGLQESELGIKVLQAILASLARPNDFPKLRAYSFAALVNFLGAFTYSDLSGAWKTPEGDNLLNETYNAIFAGLSLSDDEMWVRGNAIDAMTRFISSMDVSFDKYYQGTMAQLMSLFHRLPAGENKDRIVDCLGILGATVTPEVFAPDAVPLLTVLNEHLLSLTASGDDHTPLHYLLATMTRLADTVGAEMFAPYLGNVFPRLWEEATRKPEVITTKIVDEPVEDIEEDDEDDTWERIDVGDDRITMKKAELKDKIESIEALVVLVPTVGKLLNEEQLEHLFVEATDMLKFVIHNPVRDAAASLLGVTVQAMVERSSTNEQRIALLDRATQNFVKPITIERDLELLTTLLATWTKIYKDCVVPGMGTSALSDLNRTGLLKGIETQLVWLGEFSKGLDLGATAEPLGEDDWQEEEDDDDSDLEGAELTFALNRVLGAILEEEKSLFPIEAFIKFLPWVQDPKGNRKVFAMRFIGELIAFVGGESFNLVSPFLDHVTRQIKYDPEDPSDDSIKALMLAASIVKMTTMSAPEVFRQFILSAVEPLFASIEQIPFNYSEDGLELELGLARDSCITTLTKIMTEPTMQDVFPQNQFVHRWLTTLPMAYDTEEIPSVYEVLFKVMESGHPTLAQIGDHLLTILLHTFNNQYTPGSFKTTLASVLSRLIESMVPAIRIDKIDAVTEEKIKAYLA